MPEGIELAEVDEVELFGRVYDRAPGSMLYVPTDDDVVERVIARKLADAPEPPMPVAIDLFCGAGGFSLGMHEAGIDVVAAVEWDAAAASTYMLNLGADDGRMLFATEADERRWKKYVDRAVAKSAKSSKRYEDRDPFAPGWMGSGYRSASNVKGGCRAMLFGDISHVTGAQLMEASGVDHVHVVFGGPPCQGLSKANSKSCLEDPRNGMLWEYLRIVEEIQPDTFVIENVTEILTVANGALFNAIATLANESGYNVVANKLDAANYGVPQYRRRAIIVGSRPGKRYCYPMPSTWAVGRPIDDNGWQIGAEFEDQQRRLPVQAHYDRATRRWWFGDPDATGPAPHAQEAQVAAISQSDLFGA